MKQTITIVHGTAFHLHFSDPIQERQCNPGLFLILSQKATFRQYCITNPDFVHPLAGETLVGKRFIG